MVDIIVNYGALIAYLAFTIEILLQIKRILDRKSSEDISVASCVIRLLAGIMLFVKMIFTRDTYLILGQGVSSIMFFVLVFLVIYFRLKKPS